MPWSAHYPLICHSSLSPIMHLSSVDWGGWARKVIVSLSHPSCCQMSICHLPTVLNHSVPLQTTPSLITASGKGWFDSVGKTARWSWRWRAGRGSWKPPHLLVFIGMESYDSVSPPLPLTHSSAKLAKDSSVQWKQGEYETSEWHWTKHLFLAALARFAYSQRDRKPSCLQSRPVLFRF